MRICPCPTISRMAQYWPEDQLYEEVEAGEQDVRFFLRHGAFNYSMPGECVIADHDTVVPKKALCVRDKPKKRKKPFDGAALIRKLENERSMRLRRQFAEEDRLDRELAETEWLRKCKAVYLMDGDLQVGSTEWFEKQGGIK